MDKPISGKDFLKIVAALPEVKNRKLDLTQYQISVSENNTSVGGKIQSSIVVSFIDASLPWPRKITPGSPGRIPGFEVILKKDDLSIIQSHFMK